MGQLPNPNEGKPFDRVISDHAGNPVYGMRKEHTPDEEIVNLRSGQSNQQYWQPELVLNPEGCAHVFVVTDIGAREVECELCHLPTTFHAGINYFEEQGNAHIRLKGTDYPLRLHPMTHY